MLTLEGKLSDKRQLLQLCGRGVARATRTESEGKGLAPGGTEGLSLREQSGFWTQHVEIAAGV